MTIPTILTAPIVQSIGQADHFQLAKQTSNLYQYIQGILVKIGMICQCLWQLDFSQILGQIFYLPWPCRVKVVVSYQSQDTPQSASCSSKQSSSSFQLSIPKLTVHCWDLKYVQYNVIISLEFRVKFCIKFDVKFHVKFWSSFVLNFASNFVSSIVL